MLSFGKQGGLKFEVRFAGEGSQVGHAFGGKVEMAPFGR